MKILPALCLLAFLTPLYSRAAEPIRVACLGDSLTAGAKVNAATESYPAQLQTMLGSGFVVKNFGKGGATMIRRGKPNAFQELPEAKAFLPQIAIVNFGINDTRSRDADFWSHFDEFPADAKTLVTELLELPSKPAILLCLPTANSIDVPGETADRKANVGERLPRLVEVNAKLRELAKSLADRGVVLVDLTAATEKHPELFNVDGVHMNPAGYKFLAETLRPHVEAAAKKTR